MMHKIQNLKDYFDDKLSNFPHEQYNYLTMLLFKNSEQKLSFLK